MGGFEPVAKPWGMDGHPGRLRLLAAARGLGSLPGADGAGDRPHPRARDRAGAPPRQRAGELHARRPLPPRRGARVPELLRRRRLQLHRHRLGGGRRQGGGGVDRGRRAARWTSGTWTSAAWRRSRRNPALPARAHRGDGRPRSTPCTGPSSSRRPRAACGKSVLHDRLAARGACFGEVMGWERANWYAAPGMEPVYRYSYGRQNWFACAADEHRAVREAVGLFDQSSFAKLRLEGPDAAAALQRLCANDVDVPVGRIVYTQMLNRRGGIECDLTVTRLDDDAYLVVTAAAAATHDAALDPAAPRRRARRADRRHRRHRGARRDGPALARSPRPPHRRRSVERGVSVPDLARGRGSPRRRCAPRASPTWASWAGSSTCRRSSPPASTTRVVAAGAGPRASRHAGYHAMDSLRIEKAYRSWGHDIGCEDTPLEAGLGFAVRLDKAAPFIGREALLAPAREAAVAAARRLHARRPGAAALSRRADLARRRARRPHHLGRLRPHARRAVGLGYVAHPDGVTDAFVAPAAGSWRSRASGAGRAQLTPPYDPKSIRVRG